ncbi:hypothetical protein K491DRAFT_728426 [Lophiostoma macrostomum CBS 122681]|uniref:Uncharacterized protein n=1 Tax=Lophiostoma macrostomum CBS 122681 TaxID=1314788 RepID=A0A6A6SZA5_9PLEO|nr:hypothetical protein K491DRAFT_728426 [Lophiostoma macrostomum CBS 122681]
MKPPSTVGLKPIDKNLKTKPKRQLDPKATMFTPAASAAPSTVVSTKEPPMNAHKAETKVVDDLSTITSRQDLIARNAAQKAKREALGKVQAWNLQQVTARAAEAVTTAKAKIDEKKRVQVPGSAPAVMDDLIQKVEEMRTDRDERVGYASHRGFGSDIGKSVVGVRVREAEDAAQDAYVSKVIGDDAGTAGHNKEKCREGDDKEEFIGSKGVEDKLEQGYTSIFGGPYGL